MTKIFIIGAGDAAHKLLKVLKKIDSSYQVAGFIDDDKDKIGRQIEGIKISGPISELPRLIKENQVQELFIAIPSAQSQLIRKVVEIAQQENLKSKIIPRTIDIIRGLVRFEQVRDIKPQDLLGRPVVKHDLTIASDKVKDKIILITGAAGSIGSELAKQMAILKPKKIVCFDWWENGIFNLKQKLKQYGFSEIKYIIGNIQDKIKLDQVVAEHRPDAIFHAAAYKHVPLMEENIEEAVKNNIIGTENLAETAIKYKVKNFILISSDKAINPSSVMGATKRITEKLMYIYADKNSTKFTGVRFGNVLLSNGSVIPFFEEQIRKGGPITITDPEMVRYFMTIEEAVQLVIQSWTLGENGEIFVLDMGEPVKIKDLADYLIRAYGYIPGKDIEIKITGFRPGEKLFEEIVLDKEKVIKTKHPKIFVVKKEEEIESNEFLEQLKQLKLSVFRPQINTQEILNQIKILVPNFKQF
jgi:FlaA1/EpsC-like NDP-sugar epimerase